ncbi:hypothetical protein ACRAWD_31095 [Caulobacter segnis]
MTRPRLHDLGARGRLPRLALSYYGRHVDEAGLQGQGPPPRPGRARHGPRLRPGGPHTASLGLTFYERAELSRLLAIAAGSSSASTAHGTAAAKPATSVIFAPFAGGKPSPGLGRGLPGPFPRRQGQGPGPPGRGDGRHVRGAAGGRRRGHGQVVWRVSPAARYQGRMQARARIAARWNRDPFGRRRRRAPGGASLRRPWPSLLWRAGSERGRLGSPHARTTTSPTSLAQLLRCAMVAGLPDYGGVKRYHEDVAAAVRPGRP